MINHTSRAMKQLCIYFPFNVRDDNKTISTLPRIFFYIILDVLATLVILSAVWFGPQNAILNLIKQYKTIA
jgi:hypothetical protein